jgi:hypothetical protein
MSAIFVPWSGKNVKKSFDEKKNKNGNKMKKNEHEGKYCEGRRH